MRIDPVLDVEATTRVRDYDITIGLHGTLERLNTTYRSDPPLSSEDIVALLAFGRTQQESAMNTAPAVRICRERLGRHPGTGDQPGRFQPRLEAIRRQLHPDQSFRRRPRQQSQCAHHLRAAGLQQRDPTYITNLTRSAQQVIQFEYNINSEYTVEAIRDENGVVSFDVLIRKRKR